MKIAYFINTFKYSNWGGQATSNGLKYLLLKEYPDAEFSPIDLPSLPHKKIKLFVKYLNYRLSNAILNGDIEKIEKYLKKLNIDIDFLDDFTHVCFNGEGAVHYKSGHLIRFLGILYIAKNRGLEVASVNQTIDLGNKKRLEQIVSKVYNLCDYVTVRETLSYDVAKKIDIKKCKLTPDAVYGLEIMSKDEIKSQIQKYNLSPRYITLTGSSAFKRDNKSLKIMISTINAIHNVYGKIEIVFMASTKTDLFLAKKLEKLFPIKIISDKEADYMEAISVFAQSEILIGGRQHPNIFAYIYKTPYLAFEGNTFKNLGVAKLQNYPFEPLKIDNTDEKYLTECLKKIKNSKIEFRDIKIKNFHIFKNKKNKKSIAIVVTNLAGSGAEKVALAQAQMFQENGHSIVLFLLENIVAYDIKQFDFPIIPLTERKDKYKILGKAGDKIYAGILEKQINKFGNFDVIFSNLPRADRVVKQLSHKNKYFIIHTSYRTEIEKFNSIRANKKLNLYKHLYENEYIVTVAKSIIDDFNYLGIDYKDAKTIYNPFDFKEIREKGDEKVEIEHSYIISASAFREHKRYDILLDAFALIKSDIKLLILAKQNRELNKMIKERNLQSRVKVLGFQQNPYKYIKNAKLLVLSSDREGLPTVIIESLILGTPVVSTDCPTGPKEILTEELSNWLVPTQNPEKLSKKIDEALKSEIYISENQIKKFHKDSVYKEFMKLFCH